MAQEAIIDGPRPLGVAYKGFGMDLRPGVTPEDWIFEDAYAWPTPEGEPAPVTLMPAILKDEWATTESDTGIYARRQLTAYNVTSGSFEQYGRLHVKDYVLLAKEPGSEIETQDSLAATAGICIHFFAYGSELNNAPVIQVQFGDTDTDQAFNLNVWEDGRAFLARGAGVDAEDALAEGYIVPNRWGSIVGQWIKLFILPFGQNRLHISSSTGNGFIWEDATIPRTEIQPGELEE